MNNSSIELAPMKNSSENRDVLLLELSDAYRHIEGQHTILKALGSVFLGIVTILGVFISIKNDFLTLIIKDIKTFAISYMMLIIIGIIILLYVMEFHKEIVVYSRKIIVLRRLLGVEYGNYSYPLPNWNIVGADNPFAIKMFPGWSPKHLVSILFWLIVIFVSFPILFLFYNYPNLSFIIFLTISLSVLLLFCAIFRFRLYDRNETIWLSFALLIAKLLRLPVSDNIERDLYLARLTYSEVLRNSSDDKLLKRLIIEIEDKRFYLHNGIDTRSLIRGFLSTFPYVRNKMKILRSGGSTIEMQLVRTLIIKDFSKTIRRKIVEIILSKWMHKLEQRKILTKEDVLNIYMSVVQYGSGVVEFLKAKKEYFGDINHKLDDNDRIFLVEKLSSTGGNPRDARLIKIINIAKTIGISAKYDKVKKLYKKKQGIVE